MSITEVVNRSIKITKINGNSIKDIDEGIVKKKKLRVVAYCRVSTDQEEQKTSYRNQMEYYTNKINKNTDWELAGIYADEGITGTSTKNRTEFNKMIADASKGKFDLILTKSISRFSRNTVDTLTYIRKLKEYGIPIIFEKEGINSMETTGEFAITLLSSIAQEEVQNISTNIKWSLQKKCEKGEVIVNHNRFLGYTRNDKGELVIDEEEAKTVRLIYKLYLDGLSAKKICNYLEENGHKTGAGRYNWHDSTVLKILSNEKYIGCNLTQKTFVTDCITKTKKKNKGEITQYYIEGSHQAIIPKEVYDRVQLEKARRRCIKKTTAGKGQKGGYSKKYALSGILKCEECGSLYRRQIWKNYDTPRNVWRCSNRLNNGTKFCKHSPTLDEDFIHKTIMENIWNRVKEDKTLQEELGTLLEVDSIDKTKLIYNDEIVRVLISEVLVRVNGKLEVVFK